MQRCEALEIINIILLGNEGHLLYLNRIACMLHCDFIRGMVRWTTLGDWHSNRVPMSYTHAKVVYAVISVVKLYHGATYVATFTLKYSPYPLMSRFGFRLNPATEPRGEKNEKRWWASRMAVRVNLNNLVPWLHPRYHKLHMGRIPIPEKELVIHWKSVSLES